MNRFFHIRYRFFAPARILWLTWIVMVGGVLLAPDKPLRPGHISSRLTVLGLLWIATCLTVFWIGCRLAKSYKITLQYDGKDLFAGESSLRESFRKIAFGTRLGSLIATSIVVLLVLWTLLAIREVGGFGTFLTSVYQDWHSTRKLWIDQKPFKGARLLYSGLVGIAAYAGGIAGYWHKYYTESSALRREIGFLLAISTFPLFLLPILISQTLLFMTALSSGFVAYIFTSNTKIRIEAIVIWLGIGFSLWTLQEIVRVGFSNLVILDVLSYSLDRILLYIANDIGNVNRAVALVDQRTYGFWSFNFVFRFLFIEEAAKDVFLSPAYLAQADLARSAGPWTAFGSPYIDFGWAGCLLLFIWGFVSQKAYRLAEGSIYAASIYGLLFSSLILSWHTALWALPEFWFNVFLITVLYTGHYLWR